MLLKCLCHSRIISSSIQLVFHTTTCYNSYVHGAGPDGSSESAGVPKSTVRKIGRGSVAYFRADLNCRVHSIGESGTVGMGRPLCVPSWANWDPVEPEPTVKQSGRGLIFRHTDRRSAFNDTYRSACAYIL
jgi:hypothetical protein